MKHHTSTSGETLYWLTCDNCHDFTPQCEQELLTHAQQKGWLYDNLDARHFCSIPCKQQYMANIAKKGGNQ